MPIEREKQLLEQQWPPSIQLDSQEEPVRMSELDVNWIFCSVLNMNWKDAKDVTDDLERRFLYDKAMYVSNQMSVREQEIREKQEALESKLNNKIDEITSPSEVGELPDPTEGLEDSPHADGLKL